MFPRACSYFMVGHLMYLTCIDSRQNIALKEQKRSEQAELQTMDMVSYLSSLTNTNVR